MAKVNTIKDSKYLPFKEDNNDDDSVKISKINEGSDSRRDDYDVPVKYIYKPYIARRLIVSHNLVDIVPDKEDPDRTVFVFEDSLKLRDDMLGIIKSKEIDKENREVDAKYTGDRKVVINPCIARRLINRNHKVVDIEANKENKKRTVFIFADNLDLRDDLARVSRRRNYSDNNEKE